MTSRKLIMLGCVLCLSAALTVAQSSNGPTAASSPSAKSKSAAKTASGLKHAIMIPPEKAKPIRVPRFDKTPVIDGKLESLIKSRYANRLCFLRRNHDRVLEATCRLRGGF